MKFSADINQKSLKDPLNDAAAMMDFLDFFPFSSIDLEKSLIALTGILKISWNSWTMLA